MPAQRSSNPAIQINLRLASREVKLPIYRLHKLSCQAMVTLDGRDHFLGPRGSLESHDA